MQSGGQIYPQYRSLYVLKVRNLGLVYLLPVGEKQQLSPVAGFKTQVESVSLLEFLFGAHAQGLGRYLLEIPLPGKEQSDAVILYLFLFLQLFDLVGVDYSGPPGAGKFLYYLSEFIDNYVLYAAAVIEGLFQLLYLAFQFAGLLGTLQDILPVDVAQFYLRHILSLYLVDAEAHHQVGNHILLQLRLPDNGNGLIYIQEYALKALEQMQLVLLFCKVKEDPAANTVHTPGGPLFQYLPYSHDLGIACHKDVEVAGKSLLQRSELKELLHQLVWVSPTFKVDCKLQTGQICLVPHIVYFFYLAGLDEFRHLVDYGLGGCGIGYLVYLDYILFWEIAPAGTYLKAAPSGTVDILHGTAVIDYLASGGKIRGRQSRQQIMLRIFQVFDCRLADLGEVKAADLAGHTHGYAHVGRYQHIGEGGGQQ